MSRRCGSVFQCVWTLLYIVSWVMLVIGCILYHVSLAPLVPVLQDFPDNVRQGFEQVLGFDRLEEDGLEVQDASSDALVLCDVSAASQCTAIPTMVPLTRTSSSTESKDRIVAAFDSSLSTIQRIANDIYFGTAAMAETAQNLNDIQAELDSLNTENELCAVTNEVYCSMYSNALSISSEVATVQAEIDKFINSDMIQRYDDFSGYLAAGHGLPYILVLSAVCFFVFWWRDAAGICCGGSMLGCCAILGTGILWLTFFVLSTIFCVVGLATKYGQGQIDVTVLQGSPTLEQVIDHVEVEYPEFWETAVGDMPDHLELFLRSALVLEAFCLVMALYCCLTFTCAPYGGPNAKVGDEERAKMVASR